MKRAAGISLLELVITVAVAGILLAIAMPSFTGVINNNRLTSSSNTLVTAMHYARSEAVRRNGRVIVCPSADGATCSASGNWQDWITLATSSTGDEVLRNHGVEAPVQMSSTIQRVSFRADGLARDAAGNLLAGNFIACIPTNRPVENQRVIAVASGSRFSTDSADGSGACP
ncbi:GspH/FimT family pseudopilin [Luteimonas changyuni]|uniref:GspH/FimT family pseudopilin n=1 Tax=Luteimonas sp. MJ145 TaxID=3129234 RepID=UPI0031BBCAA5